MTQQPEVDFWGDVIPPPPSYKGHLTERPKVQPVYVNEVVPAFRPYSIIKENRNSCWLINNDCLHCLS